MKSFLHFNLALPLNDVHLNYEYELKTDFEFEFLERDIELSIMNYDICRKF